MPAGTHWLLVRTSLLVFNQLGWTQARYLRLSLGYKCMFVLDGISVSVILALRVTHATPE